MLSSFPPMYRLTARGGVGLACDERGIALGPVPLVEALAAGSRRVFRPRPAEEIARTLALAYGRLAPDDLTRCLAGLDLAARALEAGDLVKASVATVLLKLPDLTVEAFAKLASDPSLKKYSLDQARDDHGMWTSGGGASDASRTEQATANDDGTMTASSRHRAGTIRASPIVSIAGSGGPLAKLMPTTPSASMPATRSRSKRRARPVRCRPISFILRCMRSR
jgi:hypothetical protein